MVYMFLYLCYICLYVLYVFYIVVLYMFCPCCGAWTAGLSRRCQRCAAWTEGAGGSRAGERRAGARLSSTCPLWIPIADPGRAQTWYREPSRGRAGVGPRTGREPGK